MVEPSRSTDSADNQTLTVHRTTLYAVVPREPTGLARLLRSANKLQSSSNNFTIRIHPPTALVQSTSWTSVQYVVIGEHAAEASAYNPGVGISAMEQAQEMREHESAKTAFRSQQ